MRRLLITGAAGFIGANFVHYWIKKYPSDRVIALDALTYAGNLRNLEPAQRHPTFDFVKGDIGNFELVEDILFGKQIDTIVHFAAESHVDRSIVGPDAFIETNIVGTHCLLKAAHRVWIQRHKIPVPHRFHHISTDEVYGSLSPTGSPFTEASCFSPNSPYAASKASADHLVRAYFKTLGLQVTTTNCSNNYGPYQFPEKLIPLVITNILLGKPLPVYGDGQNVRDWLHVSDHCRGIDLVLRRGKPGDTYNIGGQCEQKNIDIVNAICGIVDDMFSLSHELHDRFPKSPAKSGASASLIQFVNDRPGHDRRYAVNMTKIFDQLAFDPIRTWELGLEETIQWYIDNEDWWQSILDGTYRDL